MLSTLQVWVAATYGRHRVMAGCRICVSKHWQSSREFGLVNIGVIGTFLFRMCRHSFVVFCCYGLLILVWIAFISIKALAYCWWRSVNSQPSTIIWAKSGRSVISHHFCFVKMRSRFAQNEAHSWEKNSMTVHLPTAKSNPTYLLKLCLQFTRQLPKQLFRAVSPQL